MKLKKISEAKYGDKYNYNIMDITDNIDDLKYWCDGISEVFGEGDFKKNVVSYFNSLDKMDQKKLAEELEDIVESVNDCWLKLDKIEEKMNKVGFGFSESVETKHNKSYLIKEEYNSLKLYAEANIDKFKELGKKYNCFLYGDVTTRFSEVYLDGWEKTGADVDAFCDAINKLANKYDIDAYVMKTKPDTFSIVLNEE